jgi:replicative superfamily II helicase
MIWLSTSCQSVVCVPSKIQARGDIMSRFKERISGGSGIKETRLIDPSEIFKSLVHQEGYEYLRDIQKEFLDKWMQRRDERDIVGKLNTGAGKTLVGLLMLQSKLNEGVGPVVYTCPDRQLVQQVLEQANLHNINVTTIADTGGKETAELPVEFLNHEAILVCTFERVFNGKSIFGVEGYSKHEPVELGAIVVDDAHSCIRRARQQCTIYVNNGHQLYEKILQIFEDALRSQGAGALASLKKGEPSAVMLVPYWAWHQQKDHIYDILEKLLNEDDNAVKFAWRLIGDDIEKCECYISGTGLEITPIQLPVEKIPSFSAAKHRYVLSATFYNDSDLLKELGISRTAIDNPIEVENHGDIGERLIIAPKRYHRDLTDAKMRPIIAGYSHNYNVVVIVPNSDRAKLWEKYNAVIVNKENIETATKKLKSSTGNLMVFVGRYDGVDLPGEACRILVLDGKPTAHTLRERYYGMVRSGSIFLDAQTAQIIEQGLGRAVRSGSDYCTVFILDEQLVHFISIKKNRDFFGAATRAQIDFGVDVDRIGSDKEALSEIFEAVNASLSRDPQWRKYHKEMILRATSRGDDDKYLLNLVEVEHVALSKFRSGDYQGAAEFLLDFIDSNKEILSEVDRAWYTQLCAQMLDLIDPTRASDLQVKAKSISPKVLNPKTPYFSKMTKTRGRQVDVLQSWLRNYSTGTDVVNAIDLLISDLHYSPDLDHDKFEDALYRIGEFLGFGSQRPDHDMGDGPDNLWRTADGTNFVIECKSQSTAEKISRDDVEQLLHSISWHEDVYGSDHPYVAIMMHPSRVTMDDAHPKHGTRVVSRQKLEKLRTSLKTLGLRLGSKPPTSWTNAELNQQLGNLGLLHNMFVEQYTEELR